MASLEKIAEELSALTVLEAAELSKMLEEKWGVSAAAPMAVAQMPGGAPAAEAAEEKTEFDVILLEAGANVAQASEDGWTALIAASQEGHVECVRALLARGPDPHARNASFGSTPRG